MKNKVKIKKSRSIFSRIFIPLVIILIVQIAFTLIVFLKMNIVNQAKENTYLMLNEKIFNRYMFLDKTCSRVGKLFFNISISMFEDAFMSSNGIL